MKLEPDQWGQVHSLQLNVFYNDGDILTTTGTVPVLLNGELANLVVVFEDNIETGETLNSYVAGVRYDYGKPEGEDVFNAEPKVAELQDGDEIQFVADYYTNEGEFEDTYEIGDSITYRLLNAEEQRDAEGRDRADFVPMGNLIVGYTDLSELKNDLVATYLFTDIYNNEHWTLPLANVVE